MCLLEILREACFLNFVKTAGWADVDFMGDSVGEQVTAGNNNEKPRFL